METLTAIAFIMLGILCLIAGLAAVMNQADYNRRAIVKERGAGFFAAFLWIIGGYLTAASIMFLVGA